MTGIIAVVAVALFVAIGALLEWVCDVNREISELWRAVGNLESSPLEGREVQK